MKHSTKVVDGMELNEDEWSRSFFDPGQSHGDFKIKTCFSLSDQLKSYFI